MRGYSLSLFDQPVDDLFDAAPVLSATTTAAPSVLRIPELSRDITRTDVHRPSAIDPADYVFVAHECGRAGEWQFIAREREAIRAHMAQTGGTYSGHEHGGNCMVCGSVNAIYTILFYHAKSNAYVRMGADCAEKCFRGDDFGARAFRQRCADARDNQAGKLKAQALLGDWGCSLAWELYTADYASSYQAWGREEVTARDIVGKLVQYGSISDKAQSYLAQLVRRILDRPAMATRRAQEAATAADCPTGRIVITGTVLTVKDQESDFGTVTKMLVKHETGFKVWGTCPAALSAQRGDIVRFKATVKQSPSDPKFGFASRPTNAEIISKAQQEAPQS